MAFPICFGFEQVGKGAFPIFSGPDQIGKEVFPIDSVQDEAGKEAFPIHRGWEKIRSAEDRVVSSPEILREAGAQSLSRSEQIS